MQNPHPLKKQTGVQCCAFSKVVRAVIVFPFEKWSLAQHAFKVHWMGIGACSRVLCVLV